MKPTKREAIEGYVCCLSEDTRPVAWDDPSITHKTVKKPRLWGYQDGEIPSQGLLLSDDSNVVQGICKYL